ncbi:hypothetical protein VTL71DRAFT_1638 [Oculimacula yallundae]|uniref:Secreted protein n=1 Tax=Oculimacula yallundae TaxID=86028 RepID=A0ABR4CBD1_9HELO
MLLSIITKTMFLAVGLLSATLLTTISPVSAADTSYIWVNNWCDYNVQIWMQFASSCPYGMDTTCKNVTGAKPWVIPPGSKTGHGQALSLNWVQLPNWEESPKKIMIYRDADAAVDKTAHMEFSYGLSFGDKLRWSWTAIGLAFENENTKATPNGPGAGVGDCKSVTCAKNDRFCSDGNRYLKKPHMCLNQPAPLWIDLCSPEDQFKTHLSRRGVRFEG